MTALFTPGRYAAIDCGTGSIRVLIADVSADGVLTPVDKLQLDHEIGADLTETGGIRDATAQLLVQHVQTFMELFARHLVEHVVAVATESLRGATNGAAVIAMLTAETGTPFEVLNGPDELLISVMGAQEYLGHMAEPYLFFDSGGGSTEIGVVNPQGATIQHGVSLPIGAARLAADMKKHGDITPPEAFHAMLAEVQERFAAAMADWGCDGSKIPVVAAGTPLYLMRYWKKERREDHHIFAGKSLTRAELVQMALEMCALGFDGRSNHPYIHPRGAYYLIPSVAKTLALMNLSGVDEVLLVQSGITRGLILRAAQTREGLQDAG